jgi:hypothetical protein|tara:strand:- start:4318 stop:5076 length:759 start_codon:yes stop_codon:yes gene_type:complete
MNLLVPKLSPVQLAAYLVSLVVCFIFRGEVSPDISYALDPVTLAVLGTTYAIAKGGEKIYEGHQTKKALKKYDESPEGKALAKVGKDARDRKADGLYGKSAAEKRGANLAGLQSLDAANKSTEANIKQAAAANPLGGGTAQANLQMLADRREGFIGKLSGATEKASDVYAANQITQDNNAIANAAAQKMSMLQGKAAANTAMVGGAADSVMAGVSLGADLGASGAFDSTKTAIASNAQTKMTTPPAGTNPLG